MNSIISHDIPVIIIAYLIGAIPFSYLVARWRAGIDIYEHGEGNVGARNVYHVVGPAWGVLAGILDVAKGTAAFFVAHRLALSQVAFLTCGFAAPLGHNFSPFLRFRGGKGVSVTMGFLLGFLPLSTLAGGLWVALVYMLTRDMNKALNFGMPAVVLLPPVFGAPLWTVPYVLCLLLALAVKKIIDRPHERATWARAPWKEGQPGFFSEAAEEPNGEPVMSL
jgi:glycerol-3-phosphate acyltransferase PlsY